MIPCGRSADAHKDVVAWGVTSTLSFGFGGVRAPPRRTNTTGYCEDDRPLAVERDPPNLGRFDGDYSGRTREQPDTTAATVGPLDGCAVRGFVPITSRTGAAYCGDRSTAVRTVRRRNYYSAIIVTSSPSPGSTCEPEWADYPHGVVRTVDSDIGRSSASSDRSLAREIRVDGQGPKSAIRVRATTRAGARSARGGPWACARRRGAPSRRARCAPAGRRPSRTPPRRRTPRRCRCGCRGR